ncbi:GNAT family N-acetyltransferase [Gracilinema caldarium]|uniref:GCN5-related N-acetyltransferase n=1 Tax=Gracilinema caldarium (strain ATCC 51460 / DSM 7334 / H1) TaxID=744872 RepID=F8F470_GRAC1|nr:GNAT family N-acetyltransferase [Gracilinema caldarium]AEJ20517.1 GCN5-related N-acetyltransferase [Gracilinema caldarium DSM 7334]
MKELAKYDTARYVIAMDIREYRVTDLPYLYEICLKTGDNGKDATELFYDPYVLGQFYAAPYTHFESDCVLILEGTSQGLQRPLGYILGTSNTRAYTDWFNQYWRPAALALYGGTEGAKSPTETAIRALFAKELTCPPWVATYPGHIHIDLLPEAQGGGWGRKLMDAISRRLAEKGCRGFHLGVSGANEGGIAFYRRYGMQELAQESWGIVFGKLL